MSNDKMKIFHDMEIAYNLFELDEGNAIPLWDFFRAEIYNNWVLSRKNLDVRSKRHFFKRIVDYSFSLFDCFGLLFKRSDYLFFELTRTQGSDGRYYDHIAKQFIESMNKKSMVIINLIDARPTIFGDLNINCLMFVARLLNIHNNVSSNSCKVFNRALVETFGFEIPYNYYNSLYKKHMYMAYASGLLMDILKPKKIFVSGDLRKGIYYSAKKRNIATYEFQHAGIIFEYPSYSYPQSVRSGGNIAFADFFLSFGDVWMTINHIPTKRILIGNDSFFPQDPIRFYNNQYILFIGNKSHSRYLMPVAKSLSRKLPNYTIVYKLHPTEDEEIETVNSFFASCDNVDIVVSGKDLPSLLNYCRMTVLIYSSICYEALNLGKKVVIWKAEGYDSLYNFVGMNSLVLCTDSINVLLSFLESDVAVDNYKTFYSHFNKRVAESILND